MVALPSALPDGFFPVALCVGEDEDDESVEKVEVTELLDVTLLVAALAGLCEAPPRMLAVARKKPVCEGMPLAVPAGSPLLADAIAVAEALTEAERVADAEAVGDFESSALALMRGETDEEPQADAVTFPLSDVSALLLSRTDGEGVEVGSGEREADGQ